MSIAQKPFLRKGRVCVQAKMDRKRFLHIARQLWLPKAIKKADVVYCPEAFDHIGLLSNGSPGVAGLPFI
jgi:hypothetical protein